MELSPLTLPVYNAVVSGLAAAECILWEWARLATNCARVKCRLDLKLELDSLDNRTLFADSIPSQCPQFVKWTSRFRPTEPGLEKVSSDLRGSEASQITLSTCSELLRI